MWLLKLLLEFWLELQNGQFFIIYLLDMAGQVQVDRGIFLSNFFKEVFNYLSFYVYIDSVNQDL